MISSFLMCFAVAWPDRGIFAPIFEQQLKLPGLSVSSTVSILVLVLSVGSRASALLCMVYFLVSYVTLLLLTRTMSIGEIKGVLGGLIRIRV